MRASCQKLSGESKTRFQLRAAQVSAIPQRLTKELLHLLRQSVEETHTSKYNMPLWGPEKQTIGVWYYRRTFCDAFRSVRCNNCWPWEAQPLHKPWLMDLHVYVCFSLLSALPLIPLLWPSVWCPRSELLKGFFRQKTVFLCHFASSGVRL